MEKLNQTQLLHDVRQKTIYIEQVISACLAELKNLYPQKGIQFVNSQPVDIPIIGVNVNMNLITVENMSTPDKSLLIGDMIVAVDTSHEFDGFVINYAPTDSNDLYIDKREAKQLIEFLQSHL